MPHASINSNIQSYIVCRGLFRDRGVLHRDIRPDNLLRNDSSTIPAEGNVPVSTVFISHLLDPRYVTPSHVRLDSS